VAELTHEYISEVITGHDSTAVITRNYSTLFTFPKKALLDLEVVYIGEFLEFKRIA
jgi:hypothetical protein